MSPPLITTVKEHFTENMIYSDFWLISGTNIKFLSKTVKNEITNIVGYVQSIFTLFSFMKKKKLLSTGEFLLYRDLSKLTLLISITSQLLEITLKQIECHVCVTANQCLILPELMLCHPINQLHTDKWSFKTVLPSFFEFFCMF